MNRSQMHSFSNYVLHGLFFFFYGFVKYLAFPLCDYLRFFVLRLFAAPIHTSYICEAVTFSFPWRVHIGQKSSLNHGVILDGTAGIFIGEGVRIAAYTVISTVDHDFSCRDKFIADQGFIIAPIRIEDDVWIGAGVKILKGVTVGRGSVIGAGAVVTQDIPPYSIAVGVPCRVIGKR